MCLIHNCPNPPEFPITWQEPGRPMLCLAHDPRIRHFACVCGKVLGWNGLVFSCECGVVETQEEILNRFK